MKQPEGFEKSGGEWVCRLKKGLYGMKQSGRLWYLKLGQVLEEMGFKRLKSDSSVYVWEKDGVKVVVPVFMDDLTLVSKSKAAINDVKAKLSAVFKLKDMGPIKFLLGVQIDYDRERRTIQLSQRQYIIDILARFNMPTCSGVKMPMAPGIQLNKSMGPSTPEEEAEMENIPYLNAVGALNYVAIATRPDMQQAVSRLARYSKNPGPAHWTAVKHLLRYGQETKDLKLTYSPVAGAPLFQTWVNADHITGDPDGGRSTTGYVTKIGTGAVSWSSKLQSIVALSTTEAEFVAAVRAGADAIWFRQFLKELGYNIDQPSILHIDNQSAIQVAKNPEHHGRMRHLDVRCFWLRDMVEKKKLGVSYIPTAEMTADILTKPLSVEFVERHRQSMGLF